MEKLGQVEKVIKLCGFFVFVFVDTSLHAFYSSALFSPLYYLIFVQWERPEICISYRPQCSRRVLTELPLT